MRLHAPLSITLTLLVFIILFSASTGAIGATYYVSTTGSNNNPGTESEPWATIQYGHDQANPGDIVIVKDGLYTETFDHNKMVRITKSGNADNWITIKAENKWGAVLDGSSIGSETYFAFFIEEGAQYIRLEDFEIRYVISAIRSNPSTVGGVNNIYAYRLKIHDMDFAGVNNNANTDYFTIDSSIIYDIYIDEDRVGDHQYVHNHCLYLKGKHNLVINNIMYGSEGGATLRVDGYHGTQMTGSDWSHKIINNTFHGPTQTVHSAIINFFRAVAATYSPYGVIIENNVFLDPPNGKGGQVAIKNGNNSNTCDSTSHWVPSSYKINNNVVNTTILLRDCLQGYVGEYNNNVPSASNINLTDYQNHDYTITSNSTDLIDQGSSTYAPNVDIDSIARPQDAGYDIGAYEYSGNPAPPTRLRILQ